MLRAIINPLTPDSLSLSAMLRPLIRFGSSLLLAGMVFFTPFASKAATYNWANVTGTWSTPGNWKIFW